ncbi:MAG: hypothetical protein E7001_03005 [Coriobacteriaceae bacterium]|nr:hypothetical protein [Coriobacteriaceae bacterium]
MRTDPTMGRHEVVPLADLVAYDGNAKRHTREQIEAVKESISQLGFGAPLVAWHNDDGRPEIVAGHARAKAAEELGIASVPVVFRDDWTDAQRRAYTLADNQTTMMTGWDLGELQCELDALGGAFDMGDFGFDLGRMPDEPDFSDLSAMSSESDESREFEEKFKPKRTTDDCYTPPAVYDAVLGWVVDEYGIDPGKVVRPFYPGGDYRSREYPDGCVVVDNPPFSILSEIVSHYVERGVPFFLFAPGLTMFSSIKPGTGACCIAGGQVEYENGASVSTGFITSLEDGTAARTAPRLTEAIRDAVAEVSGGGARGLPSYRYPPEVLTSAALLKMSKYGADLRIAEGECVRVEGLDAQRDGGNGIFGSGLLLSEGAAARRAEADEAVELASAKIEWQLSERERDLVAAMGGR